MYTIESHLRKIRQNEIALKSPYSLFVVGGVFIAIFAVAMAGMPKSVGLGIILASGFFMHLQYVADRVALSNETHASHELELTDNEANLVKALGTDIATTPLYSYLGITEDKRYTHQNDYTTPRTGEDIEAAKERLISIVREAGYITYADLQKNKRWVRSNQEKGVLLDQSTKAIKGFARKHCSGVIEVKPGGLAWNS